MPAALRAGALYFRGNQTLAQQPGSTWKPVSKADWEAPPKIN